jgi:periplasmic protein TonB
MFEQSLLQGGPKGKRVWTTCLSVTGQALLVAGMAIAPMVWPQVIPPATVTLLVPHAPPGHPKGKPDAKPQAARVAQQRRYLATSGLMQPAAVPPRIEVLNDLQNAPVGSDAAGPDDYVAGAIGSETADGPLVGILREGRQVQRQAPPAPRVATPKPAAPAMVQRLPGGRVRLPRLVDRVEPRYPQLARISRVEGVVKLNGVIATDGRLIELSVESGNPLLVPAAMEAVRQWRYEPTLLNGVPVEVMTTIVVTFTLAR